MSQPNRESSLAEAREQYESNVLAIKERWPHTPIGDCTSDCGKTYECPLNDIPTFEEWLENQ